MKHLILTVAIVSSAAPALAMHTYIDTTCQTTLPTGAPLEIGSSQGRFEFSILKNGQPDQKENGESINPVILDGTKLDTNAPDTAVLTLKVVTETRTDSTSKWEDDCWQDTTNIYKTQTFVKAIDPTLAPTLGLAVDQPLELSCTQVITSPVGNCQLQGKLSVRAH